MQTGEPGEDGVISEGSAVPVQLIKTAGKRSNKELEMREVLGPTEEISGSWCVLDVALPGQQHRE